MKLVRFKMWQKIAGREECRSSCGAQRTMQQILPRASVMGPENRSLARSRYDKNRTEFLQRLGVGGGAAG